MKWLRKKNKLEPTLSQEEQRVEILSSMGAKLRSLREGQGHSLTDVAIYTRIAPRLLSAIEEGKLEELPEPIYTQGLIRQFADALGLNGTEFSSSYPIGPNKVSLKPTWRTKSSSQLRPVHLYLLYVGVIVCSVSGLSHLLNNASFRTSGQEPTSEAIEAAIQPQQIQTVKLQTLSNNSSTESPQSVQIGVTLKAQSWIRVVADGKTAFEGVLPQGTQRTWKAEEELTVKADNAGGVLLSVNEQEAKQMGEPGKIQEMTIAAKPES